MREKKKKGKMEAAETKTVKKKEEAKRRRGEASGIGESKCFGILKRETAW